MSVMWFALGTLAGSLWACSCFVAYEIRKHGWRNDR